jgi:hypothetical protein
MSDILDPVDEYDDAYLLVRWLHELTSAEPNAAVVASLEDVCEDRGWHPYDAWVVLASVRGLIAAFDPDRHPRGRDGRFIELGALLKIVGGDREGQRGEVESITPDPADPGNPTIRLKMRDGGSVDVKRDSVEQAAEKARLDIAPEPEQKKGGIFGRRKAKEEQARKDFREAAGVEVKESGLTERQEDTVNGEARDEWAEILREEWIAEHPGEDPKGPSAPNFYAPAMEEVRRRRAEGRPPGPANGEANKYDAELKERNRATRTASGALTAAKTFNPDMHPRGRDGKFIEKFGLIELFDHPDTTPGQRGQVTGIKPNSKTPGRPDIEVRLFDADGKPGQTITVKPDNIGAAPEKGRLDRFGNIAEISPTGPGLQQPPRPTPGRDLAAEMTEKMKGGPKKLAPFDPEGDRLAQFEGGNPLGPTGNDDFGRSAAKLLSDDELDQAIAMRQQDVNDKKGLSPSQDLKVLEGEKASRGKIAPAKPAPGKKPAMTKFDPNADHVAQFEGGNPLSEKGNDDFGRSAAKALSDDELDQAIAMREQDVANKKGLSPVQDLKVLQSEKESRGGGGRKPLAPDTLAPGQKLPADTGQPYQTRDRPTETPEAKEQRLAGEEVRGATDEELERQRNLGPEVWQRAVAKEQENRARRRAQDDAGRQKLIASVNADAANLSTTDPEERAKGLDAILAKLRFSIIDTDKVHDHIYPPGESGRWSAERAAQHEQMWDDLLSQVEAADVPKEHDALVLGGLPGAGKSYMLRPGQKADSFGVVSWEPNGDLPDGVTHVSINPDIVKEMLIQRGMLPEGISQDLKPMEQVTFLHEESSYVAKMFSQRLGDLGYNVVLDNTMDSEGGMLKRMTPLARQGYKFRGIFADIPQDESLASAKKRYIDSALTPQGGRFVPSSVQGNRQSSKGNLSKNRDAMDSLIAQDWFTEYMVVDNTGISNRTPKGDVVVQGTGGGTAADRYLPGADAAAPKAGPRPPAAPEAPPTIDVNAPAPVV